MAAAGTVTRYLLDIAVYQGKLTPAMVKAGGFSAVNLKVSHGLGQKSVHPNIAGWARDAPAAGLGVCTFHYLTGEAPGDAQAEYAYSRIAALGLTYGTAHQLDTEADASWSVIEAYAARMQTLLGRPIVLYTGDWWWTAKGRGWNGASAVPYLWSAPNAGYLGKYPGDTSAHWKAGYGGWSVLSVMQYAVKPLAGIDVSMSAIRDETVWSALTKGRDGMSYPPQELKDARAFWLATVPSLDPLAVGIVGDDSHAKSGTSYHLGKDALKDGAYSVVESSRDRKGLTNAAAALDVGYFEITVAGRKYTLRDYNRWLIAQCEAGAPDTLDIREVIYSLDGKTVHRWDRLKIRTSGDISHTGHTHHSYYRDSETRDKTALFRRWFTEIGHLQGDDMPLNADDLNKIRAILTEDKIVPGPDESDAAARKTVVRGIRDARLGYEAVLKALAQGNSLLASASLEAAETPETIAEAVAQRLGAGAMSVDEKAAILRGVLGNDAAAVAQAILAAG
jgi:glycosyl hydrolase family 25